MERTSKKIRWRKVGGGSFRTKSGKIAKPNEVFYAEEADIPKAFRDVIIPVDKPIDEEKPVEKEVETKTYIKQMKSTGWYNVVDDDGKQMNEKAMRKEEADKLINDLNKVKSNA